MDQLGDRRKPRVVMKNESRRDRQRSPAALFCAHQNADRRRVRPSVHRQNRRRARPPLKTRQDGAESLRPMNENELSARPRERQARRDPAFERRRKIAALSSGITRARRLSLSGDDRARRGSK